MSVLHITASNFQAEVLASDKPVLLDFYAVWCGPCRMMAPAVEEIAAERPDIKVGKIDVDAEPDLAAKFGIVSIPTLVVIRDGKIQTQSVGLQPKEKILGML